MAAFRFRLDPVIRHRQMIEDEKKRDMAVVVQEQVGIQEKLRRLQTDLTDDKRMLNDDLHGSIDVTRLRQHALYSGFVYARAEELAADLLKVEKRLQEARAKLLEATKARKAVELLRERAYERWLEEQNRREANELDEIATQRHARRAFGDLL